MTSKRVQNVDYFSMGVLGAVAALDEEHCTIVRGCDEKELKETNGRDSYDGTKSAHDSAGVRLAVVKGFVRPEEGRLEACDREYGADEWKAKLSKKLRIRPSAADALIREARRARGLPLPEGVTQRKSGTDTPVMGCLTQGKGGYDPKGSTCSFRVLSVGDGVSGWFLLGDLVGKVVEASYLAHRLNEAYNQDNKHPAGLGLRPSLWTQTVATRILSQAEAEEVKKDEPSNWHAETRPRFDVLRFPIDTTADGELAEEPRLWCVALDPPRGDWAKKKEFEWKCIDPDDATEPHEYPTSLIVEAPVSGEIGPDEMWDRVSTLLFDWGFDCNVAKKCWDVLRAHGGQAVYKSFLQKAVRVRPETIELPDAERTKVPVGAAVLCAVAQCLCKLGDSFNPEISKYVRGCTALLKRTAIILIEDGGTLFQHVPWLLGMALLTERCLDYHPGFDVVVAVFNMLVPDPERPPLHWTTGRAADALLLWREPEHMHENLHKSLVEKAGVSVPALAGFQYQYVLPLFQSLGGMAGDFEMLEKAVPLFVEPAFGRFAVGKHHWNSFSSTRWTFTGWAKKREQISGDFVHAPALTAPLIAHDRRRDATMPLVHCIDQHVTPGVMHFSASRSDKEREDPNGYERRFRATWGITGHNVRARGVDLDPDDPSVQRLRSAQTAIFVSLAAAKAPVEDCAVVPDGVVLHSTVDLSVVAGGIGDIEKIKVTTNAEENAEDGLTVGPFSKAYSWNLIACFDSTLSNIHLAHMPTAHAAEAGKKPRITPTARAKAERALMERAVSAGLPFRSAELPEYDTAKHIPAKGAAIRWQWVLRGPRTDKLLYWSQPTAEDPAPVVSTELKFDELPTDGLDWAYEAPKASHALNSDAVVLSALAYRGPPGIAQPDGSAVGPVSNIVRALPSMQRIRLTALLRGAYQQIVMPTAPRSGKGVGSDQVGIAEPGDWDVWRALVLIARIVPGVLRPGEKMPRFDVVSASGLAVVVQWVVAAHKQEVGLEGADPVPARYQQGWRRCWAEAKAHMQKQAPPLELRPHQRKCIDHLFENSRRRNARGNVLALDGGMGKTITGIRYLVKYAQMTEGVEAILWFTSSTSISGKGPAEEHVASLQNEWGFHNVVHVNTDKAQKREACEIFERSLETARENAAAFEAVVPRIFVIGYELFSSPDADHRRARLARLLREAAPRCVACFDEAHLLYNPGTLRGTTAISIAERCMHVLLSTATPTAGTRQLLAKRWIQLVTPFEVHKQNVHAAACCILGAAFKNNVKAVHSTYMPEVDPYVLRQSNKLAMEGDWRGANTLVREHMRANLCKGAILMADEDRAANPGGGILLAVENLAEAKQCVELINKARNGFAALYSAASDKTESLGVVVGLVLRLTGVDLPRLGGMLWLPTGGNVNTLDQLRMRSTREKQKRSEVRIVTIVPKDTVLHRLYDRQQYADARGASLKEVCKDMTVASTAGDGKRRKTAA